MMKLVVLGGVAWELGVAALGEKPGPVAARTKAEVAGAGAYVALVVEGSKAHAAQGEEPMEPQEAPAEAGQDQAQADGAANPLQRDILLQKQEELNRREQALMALEKRIDEKLVRLTELETKIDTMLKEAKEVQDKKLRHLVDVYSNMKARQAAQVLETLDEDIAVKILAGMRGRQAGEILTNVRADKAAKLSESLTKLQLPFQ